MVLLYDTLHAATSIIPGRDFMATGQSLPVQDSSFKLNIKPPSSAKDGSVIPSNSLFPVTSRLSVCLPKAKYDWWYANAIQETF